jgi:predicted dehydrogenase
MANKPDDRRTQGARLSFSFLDSTRRGFVSGVTAAAAGATAFARQLSSSRAADAPVLRLGLVGCGGRGSGAAAQALQADPNTRLVALGDAFRDRLEQGLESLKKKEALATRIDVPEERRFTGFDAYKKVIDSDVDVVLLATPPHFRPEHFAYAVDRGKHCFVEKPVGVDAPGARKILAACEEARRKKLAVVSGLCFRYDAGFREAMKRIHGGAIGDIRFIHLNDFRGPIWVKPRKPGMTDMEWQMRNWYYFAWLSGDFNVEQHVHQLDLVAWLMKGVYPTRAYGTGGRAVRTGPEYGNIYDHHAVVYEYDSGVKLFTQCRQMAGCQNETVIHVHGTKGQASLSDKHIEILSGKKRWEAPTDRPDKFQAEHDALFASIRAGKPIDNGEYMTKSTLMGVMGRMATYSGQLVTWDEVAKSDEDLSPPKYDWKAPLPVAAIRLPGTSRA